MISTRSQDTLTRYLVALVAVAATFLLRWWLIPWNGAVAPFVLFFAMVLVLSLFVGTGPGVFGVLLSLPLATYLFVARGGHSLSHASLQSALFAVDGLLVVYVTHLVTSGHRALFGRQRRAARRKRPDHPVGGAHPQPDRAGARCFFSRHPRRPLCRRQPGRLQDARLPARRPGRKDGLRHHPTRRCATAGAGQSRAPDPGTRRDSRVDDDSQGRQPPARSGELPHPPRRPVAGLRTRHQRQQTDGKPAARQRKQVPHGRRGHAAAGLGDEARRLEHLVQSTMDELHGLDAGRELRRGLGRCGSSGRPSTRVGRLASSRRDQRHLLSGAPAASPGRRLSLVAEPQRGAA